MKVKKFMKSIYNYIDTNNHNKKLFKALYK